MNLLLLWYIKIYLYILKMKFSDIEKEIEKELIATITLIQKVSIFILSLNNFYSIHNLKRIYPNN